MPVDVYWYICLLHRYFRDGPCFIFSPGGQISAGRFYRALGCSISTQAFPFSWHVQQTEDGESQVIWQHPWLSSDWIIDICFNFRYIIIESHNSIISNLEDCAWYMTQSFSFAVIDWWSGHTVLSQSTCLYTHLFSNFNLVCNF